MTCTHAALKRQELVELGFKYDNILMEESAQILENPFQEANVCVG